MDITSIILTVISIALGVSVIWNKAEKVLKAIKELADVLTVTVEALEDKELDKEEVEQIKIEFREALAALKAIVS